MASLGLSNQTKQRSVNRKRAEVGFLLLRMGRTEDSSVSRWDASLMTLVTWSGRSGSKISGFVELCVQDMMHDGSIYSDVPHRQIEFFVYTFTLCL